MVCPGRIGAVVVVVAGCGRIGFDPGGSGGPDAAADAASDASALVACTVADCPPSYVRSDNGCYRLSIPRLPWLEAELDCEADGGHLVVEDDVPEHYTIHALAAGIQQVWVGWTDRRGPDNVFTWVVPAAGGLSQDDSCVFSGGEPMPGDADHCVAQDGTNSCPDYQDLSCDLALSYVCECDGQLADPSRY